MAAQLCFQVLKKRRQREVFGRKAFNYKYLGGSLINYPLAIDKLCLKIEPKGTELSRINQIVSVLPTEVQDKLDS